MSTLPFLVLADGSVFHGTSIGYEASDFREVVFNTSMTQYQEIPTDPSYRKQIVTLTHPHIGNTANPTPKMKKAAASHAATLTIRDPPLLNTNFQAPKASHDYLVRNKTSRHRRHRHLPPDHAVARKRRARQRDLDSATDATVEKAQELIAAFGSMVGKDLIKKFPARKLTNGRNANGTGKGYSYP